LYAISHGARAVYDGADTNQLLQDFIPTLTCSETGSEISRNVTAAPCPGKYTVADATQRGLFDPWQLFESPQHDTANSSVTDIDSKQFCFTRQAAMPLIQHSMINSKGRTADPSAFSVILPHTMMAPFDR
jgi:hypothetical protein